MRRKWIACAIVLAVAGSALSALAADKACLPSEIFPRDDSSAAELRLALVGGVPTLCAMPFGEEPRPIGCWSIDVQKGTLDSSTHVWLPGRSRSVPLEAGGCFDGYCTGERPEADNPGLNGLFVISRDGAQAAIYVRRKISVFSTATKARSVVIDVYDTNAPQHTNIGNEPVEMVFPNDKLYVVGSDAGPFIGVWTFKADGTRLGRINVADKPNAAAVNVYGGTVNMLDEHHIGVADGGLRTLLVIDTRTGARTQQKRPIGTGACGQADMMNIVTGDFQSLSKRCTPHARVAFEPYFGTSPVRLPDGTLLTPLSGPAYGSMAILDGRTLAERRRFRLPRCG
jgi:hypothetical protein